MLDGRSVTFTRLSDGAVVLEDGIRFNDKRMVCLSLTSMLLAHCLGFEWIYLYD